MSGCPVHPSDDSEGASLSSSLIRWDLVFLGLGAGMVALVLLMALQFP